MLSLWTPVAETGLRAQRQLFEWRERGGLVNTPLDGLCVLVEGTPTPCRRTETADHVGAKRSDGNFPGLAEVAGAARRPEKIP